MEMSLADFRKEYNLVSQTDFWDMLSDWSGSAVVPALCKELCEVPQGEKCSHGCPCIIVRMIEEK